MIKVFKKIHALIFKVPRILKLEKEFEKYILEKNYNGAKESLEDIGKVYGKKENYLAYNILNIKVEFLLKFFNIFSYNIQVLNEINSYKTHNSDQKRYQKLFIYNINYLSCLFLDDI